MKFMPLSKTLYADVTRDGPMFVRAVTSGLINRKEALERYGLSDEEFSEWEMAVLNHGEVALKATTIQRYRQP